MAEKALEIDMGYSEKIIADLNNARATITSAQILSYLESGDASPDVWRAFGVQRALAAVPFEELLKAGIQKAETHPQIQRALQQNLNDEIGVTASGQVANELSHATWRKDFYTALGISEDELMSAAPHPATTEYFNRLREVENENCFVISGAILAFEFSIPLEFKKMQTGRNKTFPEIFVAADSDSPEVRESKLRACKYIDDHIVHDAQAHYPDLLKAIEASIDTEEQLQDVLRGARAITMTKANFLNAMFHALSSVSQQ